MQSIFVSQRGGALDQSQVFRIVQAAAKTAGIDGNVSPHWMRHAHASGIRSDLVNIARLEQLSFL